MFVHVLLVSCSLFKFSLSVFFLSFPVTQSLSGILPFDLKHFFLSLTFLIMNMEISLFL
jgi:hypothetical protein